MKKILAMLLALCLVFCLAACNGDKDTNSSTPSKVEKPIVSSEESDITDSSEEQGLVLDGTDEYVICANKGDEDIKNKIKSIKDIAGLSVGAVYESDGQKIAEYYNANFVGFGTEHDAFSEMTGGDSLDCVLVRKVAANDFVQNRNGEIILDPIVIEE